MGMIKNAKALEGMVMDVVHTNQLLEDIHEILQELEGENLIAEFAEKIRKVKKRICVCLDS